MNDIHSIQLNSKFADMIGLVLDTKSYVYSGEKNKTFEKVGVVIVSSSGVGKFKLKRESRYLITFAGYPDLIYYNFGDQSNWVQTEQYSLPARPKLASINTTYDVRELTSRTFVRVYWRSGDNVTKKYSVEIQKDSGLWSVIEDDVIGNTYEVEITETGDYNIRVRGKNFKDIYGRYSNSVAITISDIRQFEKKDTSQYDETLSYLASSGNTESLTLTSPEIEIKCNTGDILELEATFDAYTSVTGCNGDIDFDISGATYDNAFDTERPFEFTKEDSGTLQNIKYMILCTETKTYTINLKWLRTSATSGDLYLEKTIIYARRRTKN